MRPLPGMLQPAPWVGICLTKAEFKALLLIRPQQKKDTPCFSSRQQSHDSAFPTPTQLT